MFSSRSQGRRRDRLFLTSASARQDLSQLRLITSWTIPNAIARSAESLSFRSSESTPQALQRKVLAPGSLRALRAPFASRGSWSLPDSIHFVDSVHSGSGTSRTIFVGSPAPATPQLHAGLRPVAQQLHHLARSTSRPASDHGSLHVGRLYRVRGHRNRCAAEAWRSRSNCSGKAIRA